MSVYDQMLPTWDHPTGFDSNANFCGYKPQGYVIYSRNRGSSILEEVNFRGILADLGGEGEHVEIVRHGHWACKWIEYIVVSKDAPASLLDRCVDIVKGLADYPVYSDDAYSNAQYEAICNHWEGCSMREKVDLCRDNGVSVFAARRDSVPDSVYESLSVDIY